MTYDRRLGFAFDTPEARARYLKEHPGADPSRHTVKTKDPARRVKMDPPVERPAGPEKGQEGLGSEKKQRAISHLKGVSDQALQTLKKAPAATQQFFQSATVRKQTLATLTSALKKAPKKMIHHLIEGVKEEGHEFKLAGQGIAAAIKGQKLDHHQKKAIKTVAIHMGITAAAAALTTTGVVAGLGFAAQAFAKHIALKSAHRVLGWAHTGGEIQHIGHGLFELLGKFASEKEPPADQMLAALVLKAVQEEMEGLDDQALREILERAVPPGRSARLSMPMGVSSGNLS